MWLEEGVAWRDMGNATLLDCFTEGALPSKATLCRGAMIMAAGLAPLSLRALVGRTRLGCARASFIHNKLGMRAICLSCLQIAHERLHSGHTGEVLLGLLGCLQLHAGAPWPALSRNGVQVCRCLEGKAWASCLQSFNDACGLTVKREQASWLLAQHEHGAFLMEQLSEAPDVTNAQLKAAQ